MTIDIKRAWIDPEYRATLSPDDLGRLPPNPAGETELTDAELNGVTGGIGAGVGGNELGWIRPPITWSCPQPGHYGQVEGL